MRIKYKRKIKNWQEPRDIDENHWFYVDSDGLDLYIHAVPGKINNVKIPYQLLKDIAALIK